MDTVHGVSEQCAQLGDQLRSSVAALSDDRLGSGIDESRDMVASSQIQLEEAASELRRYLDRIELDPQKLQEVEKRLTPPTRWRANIVFNPRRCRSPQHAE